MATHRMSRLHKRILRWLPADHQRTRGVTASSHEELVKALGGDKGISVIASTHWKHEDGSSWVVREVAGPNILYLTPVGLEKASEIDTKL